MSQAALQLEVAPLLVSILEREFDADNLSRSLTLPSSVPQRLWQEALAGPLGMVAARPGKEFRSRLVSLGFQIAGGQGDVALELLAIIEALHLGSLIIDDIEDASSERRGAAALHLLVGVPVALNAGNWLYFLPGALLKRLNLPETLELALRVAIDDSVRNCHYGQALDLSVRITDLRQRDVSSVVRATTQLKTGSLTELAMRIGALMAGCDRTCLDAVGRFARHFGIALQMLDDLTALTSLKRSHKAAEDLRESRATWPWAWLAESAEPVCYLRLRALADEVARGEQQVETLREQLCELIAAQGRAAVQSELSGALSGLRDSLGEPPGYAALCEEIARLEKYHG